MAEGFPTVAGWWWLSLRRGFSSTRQLLSTALVAGLLIAALGVPITLVSGAVSAQQVGAGSQLNTLRVEMPATTEGSGMTAERLNQIAQLPGVSSVVIDLKASIYGRREGHLGCQCPGDTALAAATRRDHSTAWQQSFAHRDST